MSSYLKQKVLRVPLSKYDLTVEEIENNPNIDYGKVNTFQISPTEIPFLDYVLENIYHECEGEYGKIRELYISEKEKYFSVFKKIIPDINMDDVRLVEYSWYNCTEAPDYYDETTDDFYKEV